MSMTAKQANIIFVDNALNKMFKSIDFIKKRYENVGAFNNEDEALEYVQSHHADIVFLDLDLLPDDAVTFAKEIGSKSLDPKPFIVIYSEKQDDFIHEMAFNSGVDSFINFHLKPSVLILFIDNLIKRRRTVVDKVRTGISVDTERFLILNNDEMVVLPRKEFKVFELLFNNSNKFLSKQDIALEIWKDEKIASTRTIDVHIYNIRKLFGKRIIQSKKGKGYRINTKYI